MGLLELGCGDGRGPESVLGRAAGADGVAGIAGCAAAWLGGGSGVATMLAEYPPEDAACGGSTSTVPEKIV